MRARNVNFRQTKSERSATGSYKASLKARFKTRFSSSAYRSFGTYLKEQYGKLKSKSK